MRLAKLSEFRRLVYTPGSAPSERALRARIHQIPGGTVDLGRYYVDLDAYDRAKNLRQSIEQDLERLKNDPRLAGLV